MSNKNLVLASSLIIATVSDSRSSHEFSRVETLQHDFKIWSKFWKIRCAVMNFYLEGSFGTMKINAINKHCFYHVYLFAEY